MNCSQVKDHFEALLSGQCERPLRNEIESHVRGCAECAKTLAEERKLWELLGSARILHPSHGFADRVLRQLDDQPPPATNWWHRWPLALRWGAALSAVAGIAVVAFVVLQQERPTTDTIIEAKVEHFEEFFELVQNVDVESVLNAPLAENGEVL